MRQDADEDEAPGLGEEDFPGFPGDICPAEMPDLSKHHSSVADVLRGDPSLYARLCDRRTSFQVGLARCIKVGMDNRGHRMVKTIGLVAGDEECFSTFRDLFDPVIKQHLDGEIPERHPTDLRSRLVTQRADLTGRYVVSSQVSVARCLRGFRFTPAMTFEERIEVEDVLSSALSKLAGPLKGSYVPLRGSSTKYSMTEAEEASLQRDGKLFDAPDSKLRLCSGSGRHWPHGRGVFTSFCGSDLVAWINDEEHLRLASTKQGDGVQAAFDELVQALDALSGILRRQSLTQDGHQGFAYDRRLGFLTSQPTNLGTAMQVSMVARLPRLAKDQGGKLGAAWRAWCRRQRVNVQDVINNGNTDCFEFTNADSLGISEVEIVNLLVEVVHRIIQMELRLDMELSIDELLKTDIRVSKGSSSIAAAVVAGSAGAPVEAHTEKAVGSVLFGLLCGRLPVLQAAPAESVAAAQAAAGERPPARHGRRPSAEAKAGGGDNERETAELLFGSILKSVVEDSGFKGRYAGDEAEEVNCYPDMLIPERPTSAASWDARSTYSVRMSSASSAVNQIAAAEVVDDLMTAAIERRAQELEDLLDTEQCSPSELGATSVSTAGTTSLKVTQQVAREIVANALRTSIRQLKGSAPSGRASPASEDVLRAKARECLLGSIETGMFDKAIQITSLRQLKQKARDILENGVASGKLTEMLQEATAEQDRSAARQSLLALYGSCAEKAEARNQDDRRTGVGAGAGDRGAASTAAAVKIQSLQRGRVARASVNPAAQPAKGITESTEIGAQGNVAAEQAKGITESREIGAKGRGSVLKIAIMPSNLADALTDQASVPPVPCPSPIPGDGVVGYASETEPASPAVSKSQARASLALFNHDLCEELQEKGLVQGQGSNAQKSVDELRREVGEALEEGLENGSLLKSLEFILGPAASEGLREPEEEIQTTSGIRLRLANLLVKSAESGDLITALKEARMPDAGEGSGGCEISANMADPAPPPRHLVPAAPADPAPRLHASASNLGDSGVDFAKGKQAPAFAAFQIIAERARRAGELAEMIKFTQREITLRQLAETEVERNIAAMKADLAHLELDIEWHKQALTGADRRREELESNQRSLLADLDFNQQRFALSDSGQGAGAMAVDSLIVRSELSTATGGATLTSLGSIQTPRQNKAMTLEPLPART